MSHLTVAISEKGVQELFAGIRDNFTFADSDSLDFGGFTAGYDVALHLDGGSIELTDDNTIKLDELDVKWDKLRFFLTFDIDEICVGGGCVSIFGAEFCLPEWCIFSANPDINLDLDLSAFITTSEISGELGAVVQYYVHPDRTAAMTYLDVQQIFDDEENNLANKWQVILNPVWLDIDPIDFADTVGDLLEAAVEAVVGNLLAGFPDWAKDLILAIMGSIIDLLRSILDIVDDVDEWLSDLFNFSFGLVDLLLTLLADYLAAQAPIEFDDPVQVLEAESDLIPVKIPIEELTAEIKANEMVLRASVGASL